MQELEGKKYCRVIYEFVTAAQLTEDASFGQDLFLKGDFVIRLDNGSQFPVKKSKFEKLYTEVVYSDFEDIQIPEPQPITMNEIVEEKENIENNGQTT